jgi:hypothetical protein
MKIEPMMFLGCWIEYQLKPGVMGLDSFTGRGYVSGVTVGASGGRVGTRLLICEKGEDAPYGWDVEMFADDVKDVSLLSSPPL